MTGPGTNTYLIGDADIVVIDPGPDDLAHLERIVEIAGGNIRYVVVTHSHRDHAPGAATLARITGATMLGFDKRPNFVPDGRIVEGDVLMSDRWRLEALHTPGHSSDHLCFIADAYPVNKERVLFSGDHIMEGSTVVIGPPDGDMSDYFHSLKRLLTISPPIGLIAPGHGMLISDPVGVVGAYIELRERRESAIYAVLVEHSARVSELVPLIYTDLPEVLIRHAGRSIWAHLRKLHTEQRVSSADPDDPESLWEVITI
jgi:glyoxylase-like metal-dependent hydrolase (beta-lactamase superfamily II)